MTNKNVKIQNLDKLIKKLNFLGGNLEKVFSISIKKSCIAIEGDAKKNVKVDTGLLRNSLSNNVVTKGNKVKGMIGTNIKYARYIELGTGPKGENSSEPFMKKAGVKYRKDGWKYYSEKLGRVVYTKGQPASPFLYPAFKNNESFAKKIMEEELVKEIRRLTV